MIRKYFQHIISDASVILRIFVILIIGGVILFQNLTLKQQDKRVQQIEFEQSELYRLAVLAQKLRPKPVVQEIVAVPEKPKKTYVLEGSSLREGTYQAVINGRVYRSGDPLDDFIVTTITMDSATLVHTNTGETKNLEFLGPLVIKN